MLEILNRYIHGYVAMPVILTCYRKGVFDQLGRLGPVTLAELSQHTGANSGHLQVALRMFESMGWVHKNNDGYYKLAMSVNSYHILKKISYKILSLYNIPIDSLLRKYKYRKCLRKWLSFVMSYANDEMPIITDFVQGIIIVPLLIALKKNVTEKNKNKPEILLAALPRKLRKQVIAFFVQKGWAEIIAKRTILTDAGLFMLDRAFNMAVAASHAPLLSQMKTLLFGNAKKIFKHDRAGHELHLDRTLNVLGSGFQHARYFADVEEIIIAVFNKQPYEEQPKYVIDMGCGDGSLLKKIYDIVCHKTNRGKVIQQYPLYMIGVDFNKKALLETKKTLQNIPHYTLQGDIGCPIKMIHDLEEMGINDHDNSLHIRSFLDHDRPYIAPAMSSQERNTIQYQGEFVSAVGAIIHPAEMIQSLVEHFARWSAVTAKHGLLILEVHSLSAKTVAAYFNESESFHFDALQAFTKQYLVSADVFLLAAAESGLFPKMEFARRYPLAFPYTRISLNLFEKRSYTLQYAKKTDVPALLKLEHECWQNELCVSSDVIARRIEQFPQGQLIARINDRIIGVVYTQKMVDSNALLITPFKDILTLHDAKGRIIQLISVNVSPDIQDSGLGHQLIEFVLCWASLIEGAEKVVGVTRCKDYVANPQLSIQQYLDKHHAVQGGIDPILRFHTSRGAKIVKVIPNYRPEDKDNQGAGVLIEYSLSQKSIESEIKQNQIDHQNEQMAATNIKKIVNDNIMRLLHEKYHEAFSVNYPLMDMGFDSLKLLELRTLLNQHFDIKLDPTFFFKYNTSETIVEYLNHHVKKIAVNPDRPNKPLSEEPLPQIKDEAIAVIGMECRFANGVNNNENFWELLKQGKSVISSVPEDRKKYLGDSMSYGGFLQDIDYFDANFFHISPREAELMDPQQRILLEVTWKALENAGINADQLMATKTGAFIGIFSHDYESLVIKNKQQKQLDSYFATGNSVSLAAGRLAYTLGLQGPAIAINTACSSSLVAVHLACQSLRLGECETAIAGGVNLILAPELNTSFANAGMISADGKCKTFDATADGYVRSEGCGVVILKKYSRAIADNDMVLAIIKGTVVNQDGASNGLTAPNLMSQEILLRDALTAAKVNADTISYLEAHGTGTKLGDPIEAKAINQVYGKDRGNDNPLVMGSVKTNLGHTEAAAGIAGLIKTVLMLKYKQIPANLHFSQLNPYIVFDEPNVVVPTQLMSWSAKNNGPLRAAVSSFGFSGTNAHVIVEESILPEIVVTKNIKPYYLITLSTKSDNTLKAKISELALWLTKLSPADDFQNNLLEKISFTLNVGRRHFEKRCAVVVADINELRESLRRMIANQPTDNVFYSEINGGKFQNQALDNNILLLQRLTEVLSIDTNQYKNILMTIAEYYISGGNVNWKYLHQNESNARIAMPSYPFDKERYWYDSYEKTLKLNKSITVTSEKDQAINLTITEEGIAVIRIEDKIGKNQLSFALLQALERKFQELDNNSLVKVVIITGYDDIFCLGGSEEVLLAITKSQVSYTDMPFIYRGLLDCKLPVIAAMQGHAFGAGLAFGLYADMTVMSEDSLYTANFMKYGFTPGVGSTLILKEKLNEVIASEMMWTAREYRGSELKNRGAAGTFKRQHEVFTEAMNLAKSLTSKPRQTLMVFKKTMSDNLMEKLSKTITQELRMHSEIFANPEATENIKSYFNKLGNYNVENKTTDHHKTKLVLKKPQEKNNNQHAAEPSMRVQPVNSNTNQGINLVSAVAKIVANKLHIQEDVIDLHSSFNQLGIDSINAVEIVRDINQLFSCNVESTLIYDYPSIKQLATYLEGIVKKNPEITESTLIDLDNNVEISPASNYHSVEALFNNTNQKTIKLKVLEKKSQTLESKPTDIAIIGFSGRFPGADTMEEYWQVLSSGESSITEIPSNRWPIENFYDQDPQAANRSYSKWGGFLNDVDKFDPLFFGISPAEAEMMDPQQRLFLQECWKVFENVGYSAKILANKKCGVFVGVQSSDYDQLAASTGQAPNERMLMGMNCSVLAARISYLLDLKGPSIATDTACSSSLVTIHQACQSIILGECEIALAGGVNIFATPKMHIMTSKAGMLSPDGKCKTFDDSANGFVPSEAVGVVLLKSLNQAIKDKDTIYGIIKASGINQDGKTNGMTAPSAKSQTDLEVQTYKKFNIDPQTISYIEAHGTGTKLGDPIEVSALTRAFREYTEKKQFCAIGSVKTNIGHALLAAGIASVIKMLLCLKHKKLVPSINYIRENEHINFNDSPFYLNTVLKDWVVSTNPRRAAVSSFGLSGTNAHLVIEEPPSLTILANSPIKPAYLMTFSAKTELALKQKLIDLKSWLVQHNSLNTSSIEDISYTLNVGRNHYDFRAVIVAESVNDLLHTVDQINSGNQSDNYRIYAGTPNIQQEALVDELLAKVFDELKHYQTMDVATYKKKLLTLGNLYINGYDIDWEKLHSGEVNRTILLPTYPFAKQRYWISDASFETQIALSPEKVVTKSNTQSITGNDLYQQIIKQIMQMAADLLKIKLTDLQATQKLSEYGMDSISMTNLTNLINNHFGLSISPAILFEHQTFESYANYLVTHFQASFEKYHEGKLPLEVLPQTITKTDDIAIIGMSGILPGAATINQFWDNIINGIDSVSEIPKERWDWQKYYGDSFVNANKTKIKWGGFINDISYFDAAFFNLSPREAALIDPQQRLFLETAVNAVEDAGYSYDELGKSKTGVFVGVVNNDYAELLAEHHITDAFVSTGVTRSIIANRVSYLLNLNGPSEAIDTACSSSLVAIHHAVKAIRNGDCETAIAGAVNALLTPTSYLTTSKAGMLSEDGKCKSFDKHANGYVRSEGVAAVVLKSLRQAQQDGDFIYGVIKGVAINHGGHVSSLTVPNPNAQADVVVAACQDGKVSIDTITYIETHGTGTPLGDPIEINGLKKAFSFAKQHDRQEKPRHSTCALGSVKTNIGHLESASGIAGMIKVLKAMQYRLLPGNIHFTELNPYINLDDSPFYILTKTQPWQRLKDHLNNEIPLRAGISSFGFGGVNAHVVIEEAPINSQSLNLAEEKPYYLILLSAKEQESLKQKMDDLYLWLKNQRSNVNITELCFTLSHGRNHYKHRCAIVVKSLMELQDSLHALINGGELDHCFQGTTQLLQNDNQLLTAKYQAAINKISSTSISAQEYYEHLRVLAELYLHNYSIDWLLIYQENNRKRIASLPTYPFIKRHYWLETQDQKISSSMKVNDQTANLDENATSDMKADTIKYLLTVFAELLKLSPQQIDIDTTYETYGVDSLLGLEITKRLERDFGTLPKTLLYEKNCLSDLAQYFLKKYNVELQKILQPEIKTKLIVAANQTIPNQPVKVASMVQDRYEEGIAIIGLNGTYPKANDLNQFWQNLSAGIDCITEIPPERWNYKDYPVKVGAEDKYYQYGGFIADIDKFDPLFFNIAPSEAALLDPQERLFLQSACATLEDAGYVRDKLKSLYNNQVGVFAGVTYNFYPLFIAEEWQKGNRIPLDIQLFSIANRVSYFLNLKGPSIIIDTACSSSLVAIHMAYESIMRGECMMAIAGGVNLSLHPCKYHMLGSYSFMADNGRCTSFGANGNGYVPGEGVGSVLLKPLSLAIKDNDHIYGVIKSSSINHGGKTSGYTVPNPAAQAELIKSAIAKANIDPRTISYIEAHGTGTSLGDPIEIRGLQEAFEEYTQDKQFCAIGSVKSNIGHLESAAGISQLTKVLLQLEHKQLVPSLHAEELNPFINFEQTPFYVQRQLSDWESPLNQPRRAGISSFGAGGTNVHLIIEEYTPKIIETKPSIIRPLLFLLSAIDKERLHQYIINVESFFQHENAACIAKNQLDEWMTNVCYTSQIGREHRPARFAVLATSAQELMEKIRLYLNEQTVDLPGKQIWINEMAQAKEVNNNIADYIQQANYAKLAELWVNGTKIPWEQLYGDKSAARVPFPTYPFAKRRCWITQQKSKETVVAVQHENINEWLYTTCWQKQELDYSAHQNKKDHHWIIFADKELGTYLQTEYYSESNIYCIPGRRFVKKTNNLFTINPTNADDYIRLFSQLHIENNNKVTGILYFSSLSAESQHDKFTYQLFDLLQALVKHQWQHRLQFCLITHGSQAVKENAAVQVWQHYLWSFVRAFAAEYPQFSLLLLDLDIQLSVNAQLNTVMHELAHYNSHENHIAYTGNERYVLRLVNESREESSTNSKNWRVPETVLITGGLGALGGEVAKWLADQGCKNLLLTGTTELPDRSHWQSCKDVDINEKIKLIQHLEVIGVTVKYVAVNIIDKQQMQAVKMNVEKEWNKPIQGVFHLAGVTTDNIPLANMTKELLKKVLSAKVQGAMVLDELFRDTHLQCFVLFSSISALPYFGIGGLSAYSMANEFLNGLALARRSQGLPAISINWAAWADKGMSYKYNHSAFLQAMGMSTVAITQGLKILYELLRQNLKVVTVAKINWQQFLSVNADAKQLAFFSHYLINTTANSDKSSTIKLTRDGAAKLLINALSEVLDLKSSEIQLSTPLQNYGMDSIIGIHFVSKVNQIINSTLSPMDLYRYPTILQLVEYISGDKQPIAEDIKAKDDLYIAIGDLDDDEVKKLIEEELDSLAEIE